jgi:NAD(P)-dependent dehydrogenase (short-subunit alcohol dehydrogenase family)
VTTAATRVALVTGAGSGIGRATALEFARTGAQVAVLDIDESAAADTLVAIQEAGGEGLALHVDIGDERTVQDALGRVLSACGRLDFAVNNAGVSSFGHEIDSMTLEEFERVVHINLGGTFLCLKHELPVLSDGGAVVNIASSGGLHPIPNAPAYVASKHGVVGLTKAAARDYAARNIRINALCPGATHTPFYEKVAAGTDMTAFLEAATPLGRLAEADEVAAAAVWLCSDSASYITGVALPIDGGRGQ